MSYLSPSALQARIENLTQLKIEMWKECSGVCHYCSRPTWLRCIGWEGPDLEEATLDHIIPKCEGGTYERSNLVICCLGCNWARMITNYWQFKAMVRHYTEMTPEEWEYIYEVRRRSQSRRARWVEFRRKLKARAAYIYVG